MIVAQLFGGSHIYKSVFSVRRRAQKMEASQ